MAVSMVTMGDPGLTLSRIIPGLMRLFSWKLSREELTGWIQACYDMGLTTFDHADIYGGYQIESTFGEALAAAPGLREKLQLVTKCNIALVNPNRPQHRVHHYDSSRRHILESVENSLRNFQTDYLDLLLIHRLDALMDADEVAETFHELRQAGKVRFFGVSNFTPSHYALLQSRLDFPLATNQIEFSVTHMQPLEDGTLDQCQQLRTPPMIWSPLGGGGLFTADDERSTRLRRTLEVIADELGGAGIDQVALAWAMKHPSKPLPVLGTGKLDRIKAAVDAVDLQLDVQHWYMIWEASMGHEVP